MKGYKYTLSEKLTQHAASLFGEAQIIHREETPEGLVCDYLLPESINPESFEALKQLMSAEQIPCAYELSGFSGAYQDGDSSKPMLQRVSIAAFEDAGGLEQYRHKLAEAAERDHRRIGARLDLFSTSEETGQGLVLWHPKGAMVRMLLEQFGQKAHILNGYDWVYTPHIGRARLWRTSGHLDFFRDSMYSAINVDEEEYYLKPMNCPFHIAIYNSRLHSYRELPVRYAEYGTVYRYELSGTLSGMTRVRGFTQDDAHIICTPEQIAEEAERALRFSLYVLRSFGLDSFQAYISTRPEKKSVGSIEDWDMATEVLKRAVRACGLDYKVDEGGGAFYGPKIDVKLRDALDREWQCGTIQFDFNLPRRFDMTYAGPDGRTHQPYMVHRALFGSIERFTALLIEHYKGAFPLWLSPVQFGIVPIRERHNAYCEAFADNLRGHELRAEADIDDTHIREKIMRFEKERVAYILVAGDRDVAGGGISVRSRDHGDLGVMTAERLLEHIKPEIDMGKPAALDGGAPKRKGFN